MNRKILISTLGIGPMLKEGDPRLATRKRGYFITTYTYTTPDGKSKKLHCEFCTRFLADEVVNPDQIYIIGTSDSVWQIADDELGKDRYLKIIVPYGKTEPEFWEMIKAVVAKIQIKPDDQIYLDITHSFRTIPMLFFIAISYFKEIYASNFAGCFYGMYDARDPDKDETPVIDLHSHINLVFWLAAASVFDKTGYANEIVKLIRESPYFSRNRNIVRFAKALEELSISLQMCNIPAIIAETEQLIALLKNKDFLKSSTQIVVPLDILKDNILHSFQNIVGDHKDKFWKKQLNIAKWYFKRNRFTETTIVIDELLLSYLINDQNSQGTDLQRKLFKEFILNIPNIIEDPKSQKSIGKENLDTLKHLQDLDRRISDIRNLSAHAGFTKKLPKTFFARELENLISELENLEKSPNLKLIEWNKLVKFPLPRKTKK